MLTSDPTPVSVCFLSTDPHVHLRHPQLPPAQKRQEILNFDTIHGDEVAVMRGFTRRLCVVVALFCPIGSWRVISQNPKNRKALLVGGRKFVRLILCMDTSKA